MISDYCDSGLHKVKSWLLEVVTFDEIRFSPIKKSLFDKFHSRTVLVMVIAYICFFSPDM